MLQSAVSDAWQFCSFGSISVFRRRTQSRHRVVLLINLICDPPLSVGRSDFPKADVSVDKWLVLLLINRLVTFCSTCRMGGKLSFIWLRST